MAGQPEWKMSGQVKAGRMSPPDVTGPLGPIARSPHSPIATTTYWTDDVSP
jgi:hypothetical protein